MTELVANSMVKSAVGVDASEFKPNSEIATEFIRPNYRNLRLLQPKKQG